MAGVLLAACGGGDGDDAEGETGTVSDVSEQGDPVEGGTISVALEAETNSWLPGKGNFSPAGTTVAYALYDPLMKLSADGEVKPYLAESMEPNADFTQWTLTLRPNVTFHDDTTLDAEALKTIFDVYLKAPTSNLASSLNEVSSMDVVDELSVRYNLAASNAAFPSLLTDAAGWPFSPTAAAAAGEDAGANPVGTGPFRFVSWQRDSQLVVEKNENYWQEGLPHLDGITFRPIPDEDTRLASLQSGDMDAMQSLRGITITKARDLEGVDTYEYAGNNSTGWVFNSSKPPFDDVRVRQAMVHAVDTTAAIEVAGNTGLTPQATQYVSPDSAYFSEKVEDAWPAFDPERAQELYDEYINDPDRSDGQPVGTPISFTYRCPPDPSLNEIAQLMQSFWNGLGMEVNLETLEQAAHVQALLRKETEVGCTRFSSQRDPYFILKEAFTPGPLNFTGYTNPEITERIETLRTTSDVEERKAAVEEIHTILAEDVPNMFAAYTPTLVAVQDGVKNVDGWVFPDGSEGDGTPVATTMWGFVWLAE